MEISVVHLWVENSRDVRSANKNASCVFRRFRLSLVPAFLTITRDVSLNLAAQ